jgi:hypothetical protein
MQNNLELVPKIIEKEPHLPLDLVTDEYMRHLQSVPIANLKEAHVGTADLFAKHEKATR